MSRDVPNDIIPTDPLRDEANTMTDAIAVKHTGDLLPCPFCGGDPSHNDGGNSTYGRLWWSVWCNVCEFQFNDREKWEHLTHPSGRLVYPEKECFERWNTRAATSRAKGHYHE